MSDEPKSPAFLRAAELVRMMKLASLGSILPLDVSRLVAEVFRLRGKVRAQRHELKALRMERDALAARAVSYAPKTDGS